MILSPDMVRAIAAGRKTTHRRPMVGDHPCPLTRGRTVAVQPGRGRPAQLRVTITDTRWELLSALTFADACAEGFRGTDSFKVKWVRQHDKPWVARQEDPDDSLLLERFEARHAGRAVWVIEFKLSREDTPRLLAARPSPDYVTNGARALRETSRQLVGEAVSEAEQEWITAQAGMTSRQWQAREALHVQERMRNRSIEERVEAARRAATVDVSTEVFKVRMTLRAGRLQVAENWLLKLEAKAYAPSLRRAA